MKRLMSACLLLFACTAPAKSELPGGFVFLRDIAPEIPQDIRYASEKNFTGAPLPGYDTAECVLTEAAARALILVAEDLQQEAGLTLLILDCYRPARAVERFADWAKDNHDHSEEYHPDLPASTLFAQGYIARRSSHSSGRTVDLTLYDPATRSQVDMGTIFDFFSPLSATASRDVSVEAQNNRGLLLRVMERHGFHNYSKEWWHFTHLASPNKGQYFDFPIAR